MSDPTLVGTAGTSSAVSSLQITATAAGISPGDTVGIALVTGTTRPSAISITDDGGNTYTADFAYNSNGMAVYKAHATGSVAVTTGHITITLTGGASAPYAVAWKQAGESMTLDGTVNDSGFVSSSIQTASDTIPAVNGDVSVAVCAMFGSEGPAAPTVSAPYTLVGYSQGTTRGILVAFYDATSTGNASFSSVWAVAHGYEILGLNYLPPGVSVTGQRGATASAASRSGTASVTPVSATSPKGQRGATAKACARSGQLVVDIPDLGASVRAFSKLGLLNGAIPLVEPTAQVGAAARVFSRLGTHSVNTIGNLSVRGRRGATARSFSRKGVVTTNDVALAGERGATATSHARPGSLFVSSNSTGEATIRIAASAEATIREV